MDGERFALVTGGGAGIGKAAALALARTGWHVALTGRRREPLEDAAKEICGARPAGDRHAQRCRRPGGGEGAVRRPSSATSAGSISCSTTPAAARPRSRSTN